MDFVFGHGDPVPIPASAASGLEVALGGIPEEDEALAREAGPPTVVSLDTSLSPTQPPLDSGIRANSAPVTSEHPGSGGAVRDDTFDGTLHPPPRTGPDPGPDLPWFWSTFM